MRERSSPLLELVDVTRRYPGVLALDGVSFELAAGEVHALVGENGAGKSTLINIACGLLPPDGGTVRLHDREVHWHSPVAARGDGVVAVHQEAELFGALSVAENMALERGLPVTRGGWIQWPAVYGQAQQAVSHLGEALDVRQPAAALSVAQRQLAQIAAAIESRASVLILDEPTSALTAGECHWLFEQIERLKHAGVGILYVTHRQEEVFALADRITVLRDGRRVWTGPRSSIDRAELVRQMVGRGDVERAPAALAASRSDVDGGAPRQARLRVAGLTAADGRFAGVSFEAFAGQVLGVYGLIGSGRSEVAQTIFGLRRAGAGTILVDGQPATIRSPMQAVGQGLAYLPEDRLQQGIFRGLSVRANAVISVLAKLAGHPLVSARGETAVVTSQIDALRIKCRDPEQPIGELSGGNQQKVVLARWLLSRPAVLLLDEPTRGVDVGAKAEIHRLLRQLAGDGVAIVLISSDLVEVMEHADRVLVFREGSVAAEFEPRRATAQEIAAAALPVATDSASSLVKPRRARAGRVAPLRSESAVALAIVALSAVLGATHPEFLTAANLQGLLSTAAIWAILALGAGTVIMAGAIDISLGSLLALSAGVGGLVLKLPYSPALAIPAGLLVALAVGALGGLTNAALTLWGRVHPIVVTLGTMTIFRGLLIVFTGGHTVTNLPGPFVRFSTTSWLGINGSTALGLVVALAMQAWLVYRRSGRHLVAQGASPTAARLVGISQTRTWLAAFGVGGLLAALAGMIELAQTGSLQSGSGSGYELQAIAAAVIGGVSISGGRGSVLGVCLGALLLSLIYNALVLWQVSRYQYALVTGALLLAAVVVELAWRRLRK